MFGRIIVKSGKRIQCFATFFYDLYGKDVLLVCVLMLHMITYYFYYCYNQNPYQSDILARFYLALLQHQDSSLPFQIIIKKWKMDSAKIVWKFYSICWCSLVYFFRLKWEYFTALTLTIFYTLTIFINNTKG